MAINKNKNAPIMQAMAARAKITTSNKSADKADALAPEDKKKKK
jgi:hypothetical protein